ncbi:unnamed protein product [Ectocarpus sp. 12 AP-2014]
MEAARERLTDTSEKLRLAFASLHAADEEFVARTTGVGTLPLSQATSRVSQAAGMAKTVALTVLKAAEEAMAADHHSEGGGGVSLSNQSDSCREISSG